MSEKVNNSAMKYRTTEGNINEEMGQRYKQDFVYPNDYRKQIQGQGWLLLKMASSRLTGHRPITKTKIAGKRSSNARTGYKQSPILNTGDKLHLKANT